MARISSIIRGGGSFSLAALSTFFEVTEKTIYRDIDFMRNRLGYNLYCYRVPYDDTFLWTGNPPIEPVL